MEKARGNPLFSLEMAASMVESDAIEITPKKHIALKSLERASECLPDTIVAVVQSHIDSLHPSLQMVLKVSSALAKPNSPIYPEMLQVVFPVYEERTHLRSYLEELAAADLVAEMSDPTPLPQSGAASSGAEAGAPAVVAYQFASTIVQQVAYSLVRDE